MRKAAAQWTLFCMIRSKAGVPDPNLALLG